MEIKCLRKQLHKLDRASVVSLTERYRLSLIGFAFTYVRDEATAEDVVSDAVVRLLVKTPRLRDERALKSYFFPRPKTLLWTIYGSRNGRKRARRFWRVSRRARTGFLKIYL